MLQVVLEQGVEMFHSSLPYLLISFSMYMALYVHVFNQKLNKEINLIFLSFIDVWTWWILCNVSDAWGRHVTVAWDPLRSYFDECQKNEIIFCFYIVLFIICEVFM